MDQSSTIKDLAADFLDRLGTVSPVSVDARYDAEHQLYLVSLETEDPALLIGFHGETLSALQLFLGLHLHHQLGEWVSLSLNVNDYRQRRESSVFALADSAAARVIATGQPHSLPPMPASERRLVHLRLSDHPQLSTSSEGIGRRRSVIVSLKDLPAGQTGLPAQAGVK